MLRVVIKSSLQESKLKHQNPTVINILKTPLNLLLKKPLLHTGVLAICASLILGCAPNLGRTIEVPDLAPGRNTNYHRTSWEGLSLNVETPFLSPKKPLGAKIDGRFVPLDGLIENSVRDGLKERLTIAGADLGANGRFVLAGRINEWNISIYPDFPSTEIDARAVISIDLISDRGDVLYRATYTGEAMRQGTNVNAKMVSKTLARAMSHALDEVVIDERLIRIVSDN